MLGMEAIDRIQKKDVRQRQTPQADDTDKIAQLARLVNELYCSAICYSAIFDSQDSLATDIQRERSTATGTKKRGYFS